MSRVEMAKYQDNRVDELLAFIGSSSWWDWEKGDDNFRAIRALGDLGDIKAVKPLLNLLQTVDQDFGSEIVEAILDALVQINDESVIPYIVSRLDFGYSGPLYIFAKALVKFGPISIPYLLDALWARSSNVRIAAAETLSELGWNPPSDKYIAAFLCAKGKWKEATKYGHWTSKPLFLILRDRDYLQDLYLESEFRTQNEIEAELISYIGNTGDPEVISELVKLTKNHAPDDTKLAAIVALGEVGKSLLKFKIYDYVPELNYDILSYYSADINNAIESLVDVFRGIEEGERVAAINSIIAFNDYATPILANAISDEDVVVRRYVVKTLEKLLDLKAVIHLVHSTKDVDSEVRYLSVIALKHYLDNFPYEKIIMAIEHEDSEEKEYCSKVLENIINKNHSFFN